ncbi:SDR family oxidoreductase [Candidatus Woesearchaeota archaeon]|nr:SDR family oxidoreductase [Candidatus Woesearchaeota archaeon]
MKKVALVIGGTGGIGSAISSFLTSKGIRVYATYYQNEDKANSMKASLRGFYVLPCDIRNEDDVNRVFGIVLQKESRIDIMVNAVTTPLKMKPFESMATEELYLDINTILIGSMNLLRHIIPAMKKNRSGVIISILTSAIFDCPVRMSSYIAAKSGLFGLMNGISKELDQFNIRVLGISPSFVKTKLLNAFPSKLIEIQRDRIINTEEIAKLVLKMIEDENKYPNGTNILLKERRDILQYI